MSVAKRLLPLAAATCVFIIGLGIIIPIVPFYVLALGGTETDAPLAFSTFSAAALLSAPLWGRLSDKMGRKPVLLLSVGATAISYFWLAHAGSLWELFASRALAGFAAGWAATAQAYVSDVTDEGNRAKGMGMIGASVGLGFTIGPGIGGWAVGGGLPDYATPTLISAGCAIGALLVALIFIREPEEHGDTVTNRRFTLSVLSESPVASLLLLYFGTYLVFTAIEGVFAIWALHFFDMGARDVAIYLVFAGVVTVVVQGGIVGRLTKRIGEVRVAMAAIISLALAMIAMLLSETREMVFIPMALLAIGMGFFGPAMQSLFSRAAPAGLKGSILGAGQSAMSLARILGPAGGAAIFGLLGPGAPFIACLILLGAAFLFALTLRPLFQHKTAG